ncbi:MAG: hypothetical protein ACI8RZ_001763 [Myxococcota bacterium]|jgi:hypothetical protein
MPSVSSDRLLDPTTLTDAARAVLTDELYAVQQQVFAGVDREAFRRYVVDSEALRTRIQVYRDAAGTCIGYAALHLFSLSIQDRMTTVMRCEVGILPAHRGQSLAWKLLAREVARVVMVSPLRPAFLVACPVHPASYYAMAKTNPYLYPRPEGTPEDMTVLLEQLDGALGLSRPTGAGCHARSVGWITRQSVSERAVWQNHSSPLVQFFLRENPDYERGDGLRIACPLSPSSLARGLWNMFGRLIRRQQRALVARRSMAPAGER